MTTPADELRALMEEHGLAAWHVAERVHKSQKAVESWLAKPGSASFRNMPQGALELLRLSLKANKPKKPRR